MPTGGGGPLIGSGRLPTPYSSQSIKPEPKKQSWQSVIERIRCFVFTLKWIVVGC